MVMKYVILSDSDNIEPFTKPRQLTIINGEALVKRTIRLLKENGIKDIYITSHSKKFDNLGAIRYKPKYNDYKSKEGKGYWLSAFPIELLNEPVTFLLGDVYYSENAIKTIINSETNSVLYFCSYKNKDIRYIKHHDEPFGFKVIDYIMFKKHIERVKSLKDKGLCSREPIAWELYRSINGLNINIHKMTNNYIAINDESCDIDTQEDVILLKQRIGGDYMIKAKVIKPFTLNDYKKLKNVEKKIARKENELGVNDTFICDKEMAQYLLGENKLKESFIEIIEVIPDEKKELKEEQPKEKQIKETKKKKIKK